MKKRLFIFCALAFVTVCAADKPLKTAPDLRENGAFGFLQKEAKVFCDQPTLRFSVWNNDKYLFAQAILWTDDNDSLGKDQYNRLTHDWSFLMLNVNPEGKVTPNVDREYVLNPGPPGLHYVIEFEIRSQSGLYNDSKGRGAIRYIKTADGKQIRVDTYLIPLAEISRRVDEKLRMVYWGFSPKPLLTVNSTGYTRAGKNYTRWDIPLPQYHEYVLAKGSEIDPIQVPEGRNDASLSTSILKVGEAAPKISAKEWINLKRPTTLADLRGKVIVVDFWATWCGPCVEDIPHLNELQRKYSGKNFQLLSFVAEGHQTMDQFLTKRRVEYPIGLESRSLLNDYGITGIPHAFVIDQNGKIVWQGESASSEMDQVITKLLSP